MNALINGINGVKPPITQGLTIPQYRQPDGVGLPQGSQLGTGQSRFTGFSPEANPFQNLPKQITPHGIADKSFNTFANTGVGMNLNLIG
jgi:hypothetical protein